MKTNEIIFLCICGLSMYSCSANEQKNRANYEENDSLISDKLSNSNYKEVGILIDKKKQGIWKFYNDNSLVNVELYDKGELVYILDESDFNYKTYEFDNGLLKIDLPILWKTEVKSDTSLFLLTSDKNDTVVDYRPGLHVVKEYLTEGQSFESYLNTVISLMPENFKYFKRMASGFIEISGMKSFQIIYLTQTDEINIGCISTFIKLENDIYILTGMAYNGNDGQFVMYKDFFREIVSSLEQSK